MYLVLNFYNDLMNFNRNKSKIKEFEDYINKENEKIENYIKNSYKENCTEENDLKINCQYCKYLKKYLKDNKIN